VALALSICLLNREALEAAERYARRVTETEPDTPQGWLMLGLSVHMLGFRAARADDRVSRLQEAIRHYTLAEDLARKQGGTYLQSAAVINRAIVRMLLGDPAAEQDFILASTLTPNDPDVPRRFAVYLAGRNHFDHAVEQARAALALRESGEAQATLAALLWDRNSANDRQDALSLCLRALADPAFGRFDETLDLAVLALVELGRGEEVEPLLNRLPPERITSVTRDALMAVVSHRRGNTELAGELAQRAATAMTEATSAVDVRRVARTLVRMNMDAMALPLLQRIADTSRFDPDTSMLLDCANRTGRHQVVLEVCRTLPEAGEGDRRLLDNEINLLQLYDRPAAIAVLQDHLSRHPEDRLARLRLSALALQSEQYALVTTDPSQLPPVEDAIPSTVGRLVVGLLEWAGRWMDAIAFAYDLLRRNFGDADAHGLYCALVLYGERNGQRLPAPEEVESGVAVAYPEQGEIDERWMVVEDNAPQAQLDEYPATHPLVQRMLGLRVGDRFSLSPTAVQDRRPEITQIVSKYAFRFRDSMDRFQERFPDREAVQVMRLTREGGEDGDLDLTPLLASLDERRRHVRQLQGTYATHPTPLHLFSEAVGGHLFEAMSHLTATPDAGIRWCCQGGEEDRAEALGAARDHRSLVLDLTALFAVWRLDLAGLLRRWPDRRLTLAQATFDTLRGIVQMEVAPGPRRHMIAGERGSYAFHEITEERRAEYVQSLHRLMEFVRQTCTVACAPEVASINTEQRDRLIDLFGRDGLESVVVAGRPGHLLWTDDLTLAVIARDDFTTRRRVWTHVLLQEAVEEGVLTQAECDRYGAQLIGLGYAICWCSEGVIEQAGEMAGWRSEVWPLWQVISLFGQSGMPPQMKVELGARAIVLMARTVSSHFSREAFIRAILNRLASRRLAQYLAGRVEQLFGVDVLTAAEALAVIRDWPAGGLILP
jgi:tetratricopeptide (TPR) repeat protein